MNKTTKLNKSFNILRADEIFVYGKSNREWVQLHNRNNQLNFNGYVNFNTCCYVTSIEQDSIPQNQTGNVLLYSVDEELFLSHPSGKTTNLSSPDMLGTEPIGSLYSVQIKTSDTSIGGDENFLYDPIERTLKVYNIAPIDTNSGLRFRLYETEDDPRDVITVFKSTDGLTTSDFVFKLGGDNTTMSFDANQSNIDNIGVLSFYPTGRDGYNETTITPNVYCTSGNSIEKPFNTPGSIIFQSKKAGEIIFSTASETGTFKESIYVTDSSVTFQLRDPDNTLSTGINEFFSINQFDNSTHPDSYLRVRRTNANNECWDISHTQENNLEFKNSNGWKAIIRSNTTQNALNYVGRQLVQPSTGSNFTSTETGRIVTCTGQYNNEDEDLYTGENSAQSVPTYDVALPVVELCTVQNDPGILGVVTRIEDINSTDRTFFWGAFGTSIPKNVNRLVVSTSGVGALWVCNYNTNGTPNTQLNIGDYISCSGMNGYGMIQEDDVLHSYTVAKSTMSTDFEPSPDFVTETFTHNGITYKAVLVGCVFLTG